MHLRLSYLPIFFTKLISIITLFPSPTSSDSIPNSITPNFTATSLQFFDNNGAFLSSENTFFRATIHNSLPDHPNHFFFSVVHVTTNTILWSANRNNPLSASATLSLSSTGISISDTTLVWTTPPLDSSVISFMLLDSGNLVLFGADNVSLWESFDHPTDTFVIGQRLSIGRFLVGSSESFELSEGSYSLVVDVREGLVLRWLGMSYWKLGKGFGDGVFYVEMNGTGLYLYSEMGLVVGGVSLEFSGFRVARLGYGGRFSITGFVEGVWVEEFVAPMEFYDVPFSCGRLGLCVVGESNNGVCSCPDGFVSDGTRKVNGCVPRNESFVLPSLCGGEDSDSFSVSYMMLGIGVDYFANDFAGPLRRGVDFSSCQKLCSENCSCLGFFYGNSCGSCYLLEGQLGSFVLNGKGDHLGYVKTLEITSSTKEKSRIKCLLLISSLSGFVIVMIILIVATFLRNKKIACFGTVVAVDLQRWNSLSSVEIVPISLPGLPSRLEYNEIVEATEDFKMQIGRGGFGTVYKGVLRDESVVAIKKINSLGDQGKKEFCNEIAIIGSVRHANLVRLKGFCVHIREYFLVYEFMSKGSLEKILFNIDYPVLEWRDRFKIVLGTARALAYLHNGCHKKIIHCDIKPENILLNENLQVKISDFGLSKLLDHESSKVLTTMRGTRGYLAPEWLNSSGITDKTDVYSFGMVLLELVSGKRNCSGLAQESRNRGKQNVENHVSSSSSVERELSFFPSIALNMHKQRRYLELADPRLEGRASKEEIEMIVKIALCCVQIAPMLRPSMNEVVSMLEGRSALREPRVEALSFLCSFAGRHS